MFSALNPLQHLLHARSRLRLLLSAASAVLVLLAVFPAAPWAAEKGVVTDFTWGAKSRDIDTEATALTDLQAKWVRLGVSWHDTETSKGSYSSSMLTMIDTAVSKSRAAGSKVLLMVDTSPGWASGSSNRDAPPRNPADYASFMSFLANHYKGQVDAYEIWNEENLVRFWASGPNPAQYAQLLRAAYPAVKSADSGARVLFGGTARNDYTFLEQAYAAAPDLGHYFDVMATHPYPAGGASPEVTWDEAGKISGFAFDGYRQVHATMLAHGDDKPIWFTELGWSTTSQADGVNAATQADYLTRAYKCIEQDPYVQVAMWFNLRNNYWGSDADDWEDQLGLMWTNFAQKPAYSAFKSYTSGSGGCTYRNVGGAVDPSLSPSGTSPRAATPPAASALATTTLTRVRVKRSTSARASSAGDRRASRRRFTVLGRVARADRGRVVLTLQRRVDGRWRGSLTLKTRVARLGRFEKTLSSAHGGRWRVRAFYQGAPGLRPSRSGFVAFRI